MTKPDDRDFPAAMTRAAILGRETIDVVVSPGERHLNGVPIRDLANFHWLDDEAMRERHRCGRPQRTFVVYRHNEPDLPGEIDPEEKIQVSD